MSNIETNGSLIIKQSRLTTSVFYLWHDSEAAPLTGRSVKPDHTYYTDSQVFYSGRKEHLKWLY